MVSKQWKKDMLSYDQNCVEDANLTVTSSPNLQHTFDRIPNNGVQNLKKISFGF